MWSLTMCLPKKRKKFARAVVAAEFGAVEREHALAGEARAVHGDEHGELQRAADAPEREGAAQEKMRRATTIVTGGAAWSTFLCRQASARGSWSLKG